MLEMDKALWEEWAWVWFLYLDETIPPPLSCHNLRKVGAFREMVQVLLQLVYLYMALSPSVLNYQSFELIYVCPYCLILNQAHSCFPLFFQSFLLGCCVNHLR
ncbi:hypothetical protein KIL84_014517 [Mauremys mutica]|uniref:Uncharacterized protein n=1 Tax=Mauremys mutica TaxID=74926 RepID=A0A9D4B7R4_9SAUR|nr:hypothetical protein KIL84_014517 [Mauremys mutica]